MEKQQVKALGPLPTHIEEKIQTILMRDGFQSQIRIFKPKKNLLGPGPSIVLQFAGGM